MWHRPLWPVFRNPVGLVLLGLGTGMVLAAESAPDATVAIGVRSSVDPRWEGVHRRGPIEHGKVYLIASLKQSPVGPKLVRPVDEPGLLRQLRQVLNSQGFRECGANETPEVVLTLLYGRGHLRNPYLANIAGDVGAESIVPTQTESWLASTADPRLYDKRQRPAYEHKVIAAKRRSSSSGSRRGNTPASARKRRSNCGKRPWSSMIPTRTT